MKLQDPTAPFVDVVAKRRQDRAPLDGDQFRLGVHDLGCLPQGKDVWARTAVVGASSWALKPAQVVETLAIIGKVGGLLTDMGFQVCPIGALSEPDRRPDLVVWACGDETQADEYEQLAAIGAPGLSIGSCVDGLDAWSWLDLSEHSDDLDLIAAFVTEVESLLGPSGAV